MFVQAGAPSLLDARSAADRGRAEGRALSPPAAHGCCAGASGRSARSS